MAQHGIRDFEKWCVERAAAYEPGSISRSAYEATLLALKEFRESRPPNSERRQNSSPSMTPRLREQIVSDILHTNLNNHQIAAKHAVNPGRVAEIRRGELEAIWNG